MKFSAVLQLAGKTATGIEVPESVVGGLNAGKRPAVTVTINGYSYRSTVAPYSGVYMLPVSAEVRAAAGIVAGETIEVEVVLDAAPREVTVPEDFAAAMAAVPQAKAFFDALSYSNQRRHVLSIDGAKTPETRARRIEKAMEELRGGKK